MYKLILWKADDDIETFNYKTKPTFQDMYPLIKCSLIQIQPGYNKEISNRSFDMHMDEEGGPLMKGIYHEKDNPKGAVRNKRATIAWYLWQKRTGRICLPGDAIHGNVAIIKRIIQ